MMGTKASGTEAGHEGPRHKGRFTGTKAQDSNYSVWEQIELVVSLSIRYAKELHCCIKIRITVYPHVVLIIIRDINANFIHQRRGGTESYWCKGQKQEA